METSQPLSIESFSYRWLVNTKPSFESFEESLGVSVDGLDKTSLFIEMDPNLPASRRFFRGSQDFNFDFPPLDSPVTLVHADELISNGYPLPLFAEQMKMEPYNDVPFSTLSTPVPSHAHKSVGSDRKARRSSFSRCRRSSKRILRKCLELVVPVFQKFGGQSSGLKTEADDRRKQEENRFICSASTSPRMSVAYSVDNWRRSCDYESSIHEAVLHCKRSVSILCFSLFSLSNSCFPVSIRFILYTFRYLSSWLWHFPPLIFIR